MPIEFKEMLLELVPSDQLGEKIQVFKELASVAGLLVYLDIYDGVPFLSVRYDFKHTESIRTRNAGRPRKREAKAMAWGDVCALRWKKGAKAAAEELNMSLSTFYRRYDENYGKGKEEMFS